MLRCIFSEPSPGSDREPTEQALMNSITDCIPETPRRKGPWGLSNPNSSLLRERTRSSSKAWRVLGVCRYPVEDFNCVISQGSLLVSKLRLPERRSGVLR